MIQIKVGTTYRGKKRKRVTNARSRYFGRYLDKKVINIKDNIVYFETIHALYGEKEGSSSMKRFLKWAGDEVNENLGSTSKSIMQEAPARRTQGATRNLGILDIIQRQRIQETSRDVEVGESLRSFTLAARTARERDEETELRAQDSSHQANRK